MEINELINLMRDLPAAPWKAERVGCYHQVWAGDRLIVVVVDTDERSGERLAHFLGEVGNNPDRSLSQGDRDATIQSNYSEVMDEIKDLVSELRELVGPAFSEQFARLDEIFEADLLLP